MSNYTKTTNFGAKDTLPSGDSQKIIRGTEFDTEFNNVATAIATKLEVDGSNNLAISGTFSSTKLIPTGGTATGNGMYLPAANAVAISTNGTERLRIDSSGVASFASNPILNGGTANGLVYLDGSKVATSGSAVTFDGTNLATTGTASATKLIPTGGTATGNGMYLPAANTLALSTNGTERVRVDSSGNLGVGTASPNTYGKLAVVGDGGTINLIAATDTTTTSVQHRLFNSSGTSVFRVIYYGASYASGSLFNIGANGTVLAQEANAPLGIGTIGVEQPLIFGTNSVERARIDSSGNLGVGTTVGAASGTGLIIYSPTSTRLQLRNSTTGDTAGDGCGLLAFGSDLYVENRENGATLFFNNGSERARIASSGNVGIGTASPAYSLDVNGAINASADIISQGNNARISLYRSDGINYFDWASGQSLYFSTQTSAGGGGRSTKMTLDSAGNLTVGQSTSNATLADAGYLSIKNTANTSGFDIGLLGGSSDINAFIYQRANGYLAFGTNNTEKARITSGGDFLVGTTAKRIDERVVFVFNGTAASGLNLDDSATTGTSNAQRFYRNAVQVGTITTTTTATAYNTSSDYRLKDNQQPLTGSGAFIDALQPKTWDWATDGSKGVGFIAHEVQTVSPNSVVGEKDAVDADGNPIMQAMEYGSAEFIANIVAELQSLRARVATLENN